MNTDRNQWSNGSANYKRHLYSTKSCNSLNPDRESQSNTFPRRRFVWSTTWIMHEDLHECCTHWVLIIARDNSNESLIDFRGLSRNDFEPAVHAVEVQIFLGVLWVENPFLVAEEEKLECLVALCCALLHPQLHVRWPAGTRCVKKLIGGWKKTFDQNLRSRPTQNAMKHLDMAKKLKYIKIFECKKYNF